MEASKSSGMCCCVAGRVVPDVATDRWAFIFRVKQYDPSTQLAQHPSGHYMYHQVNISQFYVLPAQCINEFCVDLRTNSDYFPLTALSL